jgi:hypothetical protein
VLVLVLVLVLSAAVLVLVLETAHHDLVLEHRDHACRCFATPPYPLARFLGLASEADAWHCFAIQSRPAFSAVESQRDGQVIASDANPRSRDRTNSPSRNATACVDCGCDSEHEHEHEHEHDNRQDRDGCDSFSVARRRIPPMPRPRFARQSCSYSKRSENGVIVSPEPRCFQPRKTRITRTEFRGNGRRGVVSFYHR